MPGLRALLGSYARRDPTKGTAASKRRTIALGLRIVHRDRSVRLWC